MKQNVMLTIASLLSVLLLTLHITDDIVRGISKPSPQALRWPFSWYLCTGRWCSPNGDPGVRHHAARRVVRGSYARHAAHEGARDNEIAKSPGGFFFITGHSGARRARGNCSFILSARGLWSLRRGQPRWSNHPNSLDTSRYKRDYFLAALAAIRAREFFSC